MLVVCMSRVSSGNKCFCCTAMQPLAVCLQSSALHQALHCCPDVGLLDQALQLCPRCLCCCGSLTACKQLLAGHFLQFESARQCCNLLALAAEADRDTMPGVRQATASSPAWFCIQQLLRVLWQRTTQSQAECLTGGELLHVCGWRMYCMCDVSMIGAAHFAAVCCGSVTGLCVFA